MFNSPISSGSGIASGKCTETSCLRVATRYCPGGTSPGSASGNWSTDLGREGWSINFSDKRHSETAIFPVPRANQGIIFQPNTNRNYSKTLLLMFYSRWDVTAKSKNKNEQINSNVKKDVLFQILICPVTVMKYNSKIILVFICASWRTTANAAVLMWLVVHVVLNASPLL